MVNNIFFYKIGMAHVPSTFPRENFYNYSTEESESDAADGKGLLRTNAFGQAKTSSHNRPPRSKRLFEKCEKIATRKSKCILQMHEAKKELDKVNINIRRNMPSSMTFYSIVKLNIQ